MKEEIIITIRPEGWVDYLVLDTKSVSSCGSEKKGLSICVNREPKFGYGGVIRREDMKKLIDVFQEHLERFPLSN